MFKSLLSTAPGSLSSTRFSFLLCVIISNLSVFLIWGILSIKNGNISEVPESIIFLYSLANGITFTGKLVQKNIESTQIIKEEKEITARESKVCSSSGTSGSSGGSNDNERI